MDARMHRRVQRYGWDLAVADYDRHWVPVLRSCSDRSLALADIQPGERVLDVATGTGVAAFLAAERTGPGGAVVATDISDKMVEATRDEARRRGVANITCERTDAEDLSFDDASFDAALCVLGMMYPADPQRAIEQMFRVLRPGGRAVVCVWGRRDRCGWNAVFPIIEARVTSDVCPMFFSLGAPGGLEFAFEQAGFTDLHEERHEITLDWKDDEDACAALFPGGPVALPYSKFDDATRSAVHAEYIDSISQWRRPDGGYNVPGEFVYMLGRRQ
jgi:ubiquinone/menaquinone biosynthesis C-methylase UbiE